MSPNGRPSLTASMTPDQLAAFEEHFMREIFILPDNRVAKSCLVCLDEAKGLFVRLYSVLVPEGKKEEANASSRFSLSVYQRQPDGTLADVTAGAVHPWVAFNGRNNPELIGPADVLRFMGDVLEGQAAAQSPKAGCPLPEDAMAIKFNAPVLDVDTVTGKQPDPLAKQQGRGTITKAILSASSLPQAKPH